MIILDIAIKLIVRFFEMSVYYYYYFILLFIYYYYYIASMVTQHTSSFV